MKGSKEQHLPDINFQAFEMSIDQLTCKKENNSYRPQTKWCILKYTFPQLLTIKNKILNNHDLSRVQYISLHVHCLEGTLFNITECFRTYRPVTKVPSRGGSMLPAPSKQCWTIHRLWRTSSLFKKAEISLN